MIYALIFAAAVIAGRIYGTAEFAGANTTSTAQALPTWRTALARSL